MAVKPAMTSITHLDFDFTPGCDITRRSKRCPNDAVAHVEWHVPLACRNYPDGFARGIICAEHLDRLKVEAEELINHTTAHHPAAKLECRSCGLTIREVSDIIRKVVML